MSVRVILRCVFSLMLVIGMVAPVWAQGLSGTYTVNNGGGGDYNDLGAAFIDIETLGLDDDTVIEVHDSGTPYTSNANYKLDSFNNGNGAHLLTIRAAAGHNPVVQGAGAFSGFTTGASGTISLDSVDNVIVEGLWITGGNEFGIMYYNSSRVTIRRCVVWDCSGAGIFGYGNTFMQNCTITHNFIYNCPGNSGSTRGQASLAFRRADSGTVVTHNTVVRTSGGSMTIGVICNNGGSSYRFNELSNNVFYNTSPNTITYQTDASTGMSNSADGNCFYMGSNTTFSDNQYPTYQDWLNAGWDTNGINQDPLLVSTTAPFNLDLQPGSPCVGAGITGLATSDFDIYGTPYANPPSIGAHELSLPPTVTGISSPQIEWLDVLTITGSDLDNTGLVVTIGGTEAAVLTVNATQLEVQVADGTPTGMQVIEVSTDGGVDDSHSVEVFSIVPVLNSASPNPVQWLGVLTLSGTALLTTTEVRIDGEPVAFDSAATDQVTLTIPDAHDTGSLPLQLTTEGGTSNTIMVTIDTAPPQIAEFAPTTALWLGTLEIIGSALQTATDVTIGGVAADIVSADTSSIEVIVSDETPLGSQPVVVTTAGGSESSAVLVDGIAPIPVSVSPENAAQGSTLTITGNALTDATSVQVGGTEVDIESNTAHELVVRITSLVPRGDAQIIVTTQFGTDDSLTVNIIAPITAAGRGCATSSSTSQHHTAWLLLLCAFATLLILARRRHS